MKMIKATALALVALVLAGCADRDFESTRDTAPMERPSLDTATTVAEYAAAYEALGMNPAEMCTVAPNFVRQRLCENDYETVVVGTEIVTSERDVALGVSDGSVHSKDNLTSMGVRASDGANIHRVRSTQDQTVTIREAGGGSRDIEVKAGDTLVEVSPGATVVASFHESGRNVVKASGGHECGGCVETVETVVEITERKKED